MGEGSGEPTSGEIYRKLSERAACPDPKDVKMYRVKVNKSMAGTSGRVIFRWMN